VSRRNSDRFPSENELSSLAGVGDVMKAADIDRVEVGLEALTDLFIVAELVSGPIGVKPKAWVGFRRMHNLRA